MFFFHACIHFHVHISARVLWEGVHVEQRWTVSKGKGCRLTPPPSFCFDWCLNSEKRKECSVRNDIKKVILLDLVACSGWEARSKQPIICQAGDGLMRMIGYWRWVNQETKQVFWFAVVDALIMEKNKVIVKEEERQVYGKHWGWR